MKKYTAPAAAAMLLTALLTGGMTAHAEQQPPDLEAPDWVPSSFAEALDFDNTYGTVRIVDNAVCIVKPSDRYGTYRSEVVMTPDIPGNPDGGEPLSWHSTYHLELPEEPDQNDPDYKTKYQEYVELCAKLGISPSALAYGEGFADMSYDVYTYQPNLGTKMEIVINVYRGDELYSTGSPMTFEYNDQETGVIETDEFCWLPDCITEFNDFTQNNETVSLHDGYIVYADDVCYDGGITVTFAQSGTAVVEEVRNYSISRVEVMPPVGGMGHEIRVYKVTRPGTLRLSFTQMQGMREESRQEAVESYYVDEDGTINEIDDGQFRAPVFGDCNMDEQFGIADAVMLFKYVSGMSGLPDNEMYCWQNADLDADGRLTLRDLTLMKRLLLEAPAETKAWRLIPEWKNKGFGKDTVNRFAAEPTESPKKDAPTVIAAQLMDADTDEVLADMQEVSDFGTAKWYCTVQETVTEDCIKNYYAVLLLRSQDGTLYRLRTAAESVHFEETPVP